MQNAMGMSPRPPASGSVEVAYHGRTGEVWRLALLNVFLTVITLGVYRFWAKTRLRRYFWSRVTLNGEPVEYTGTGLELFLGFLVAIVLLAPLYGMMMASQLLLSDSIVLALILQFAPLLAMLALIPVAVFRARRYRLSRTSWRGVRAGQSGRTRDYWRKAIGYTLLTLATLGFLRPLAQTRLNSFLMNHTWFGTGEFAFDVKVRDLQGRWLIVWAIAMIPMAAVFAVLVYFLTTAGRSPDGSLEPSPEMQEMLGTVMFSPWLGPAIVGGLVLVALAANVAYTSYRLHVARVFTRGTTFGGLSFASSIRFWRVVGVFLILLAMYAVLFGAAAAIGAAVASEFIPVFIVLAAFLASTLLAPFVTHPLLAHYIGTLETAGAVDIDAIAQNPDVGPKTGEGLASVFDVDAF